MIKQFTKQDLKTGHIVKFKKGITAMLIGNQFKTIGYLPRTGCYDHLDNYTEDLRDPEFGEDIMAVYNIKSISDDYSLEDLMSTLPKEHVELLWKRGAETREINWNKVPEWTKVLVRDYDHEDWAKAYFIHKNHCAYYPFRVTTCDKFTYDESLEEGYLQIKFYDNEDIKDEWYK